MRGIRSEDALGPDEGLPEGCVASCDSILTVHQSRLDPAPAGRLREAKRMELDLALRYALDIRY
jgi:mRNA-degrading endonuclease toxin of MazEF toxin-antitoxin module